MRAYTLLRNVRGKGSAPAPQCATGAAGPVPHPAREGGRAPSLDPPRESALSRGGASPAPRREGMHPFPGPTGFVEWSWRSTICRQK